ncbi:MAG: PIN domain-containing protein [Candidatus Schekmanbacteria bacterium]|nr:PIN domain-containing protein [Candidatus Schekmanbacteria bacterium]
MKLLIDTNVFLEILLQQEKTEEARKLLSMVEKHEFYVTDFSFHSIGVLLFRRSQHQIFRKFVNEMILEMGVTLMVPTLEEMDAITNIAEEFKLDFDDAYQYACAKKYGLTIVSFDSDFDRTRLGRKSPVEILS